MLSTDAKNEVQRSDAVLSCPACFTILCHDWYESESICSYNFYLLFFVCCSQRNESFRNQFRAMFVQNVLVRLREQVRPLEGDDDPDMTSVHFIVAL